MKIVFFGTPYYVIPILESLHKTFKDQGETPIAAVVTQPPKPAGRKQILEYSEVDTWTHKKGIPKFFDSLELIKNNIKADVGILASYGAFIPKEVINMFAHGILVVHPSLLPEFRWGSPVPAAIITDTNPTGVTIIKMDEKWDHGPVVARFKEEILPEDTTGSLRDRLFGMSAEVITQMLPAYLKGKINLKSQDDSKASFARIITKEDAFIEPKALWSVISGQWTADEKEMTVNFININGKPYTVHFSPVTVHRFIRAMDPWPIAWTKVRIKNEDLRIKLLKAHLQPTTNNLQLDLVQLEGKGPVTWEQFKQGYPDFKFT